MHTDEVAIKKVTNFIWANASVGRRKKSELSDDVFRYKSVLVMYVKIA